MYSGLGGIPGSLPQSERRDGDNDDDDGGNDDDNDNDACSSSDVRIILPFLPGRTLTSWIGLERISSSS